MEKFKQKANTPDRKIIMRGERRDVFDESSHFTTSDPSSNTTGLAKIIIAKGVM